MLIIWNIKFFIPWFGHQMNLEPDEWKHHDGQEKKEREKETLEHFSIFFFLIFLFFSVLPKRFNITLDMISWKQCSHTSLCHKYTIILLLMGCSENINRICFRGITPFMLPYVKVSDLWLILPWKSQHLIKILPLSVPIHLHCAIWSTTPFVRPGAGCLPAVTVLMLLSDGVMHCSGFSKSIENRLSWSSLSPS